MRMFTLGLAFLVLAGCGSRVTVTPPQTTLSAPVAVAGPAPSVRVAGIVATGLDVPWGLAFLPDGSALISERNSARILRVDRGATSTVGTVEGV